MRLLRAAMAAAAELGAPPPIAALDPPTGPARGVIRHGTGGADARNDAMDGLGGDSTQNSKACNLH